MTTILPRRGRRRVFFGGLLGGVLVLMVAGGRAADRTVWDGVYTTAQADRGKTFYSYSCVPCHAESRDR